MKYKLNKLALSIGSVAALAAPVAAAVSCGAQDDNNSSSNFKHTTPAHPAVKDSKEPGQGTGEYTPGAKIWDAWNDDKRFSGEEDNTPIKKADMSALHFIINDASVDTELNALANHGRVEKAQADKIAAATRKIIQYYTDANFANNRIEIEVVSKVNNVFKIRGTKNAAEEKYTNDKRKVDVYGYEVVGTGATNKLKLIGSSPVALAHAFYMYVKQNEYGLIGWADARGGTYNTEHHSIHDFKKEGNSLVIPGTVKGKAFGNGDELKAATRVIARSPYEKHWFNNNVTSAYTMAYWDKSQWESHLNWLAVHGYDLILDPVATEAVQFNVWKKTLYPNATDEEAYEELKYFFTGPTFESWQRKGNMTNYGQPKSYAVFKAWNDKQVELERFIKKTATERGIDTSAQGFSGFVPLAAASKTKGEKVLHFSNGHTASFYTRDLYTTHWSIGAPSDISPVSGHPEGEMNSYYGHMLDPSLVTDQSVAATPTTLYQMIGNEIVKEYERLILDGEKQTYFNEDPFDEMHPMEAHANGLKYAHDLFHTSGFSGKPAFLADLGYGLAQATLGVGDGHQRMVTNIAWHLTYMRRDWSRRSFNNMIVGHDHDNPNFTPQTLLIVALGEDWNKNGNYGMEDRLDQPVVNQGEPGFATSRDGYNFAFYAGFQDYETQAIPGGASAEDKADAVRGMHYNYDKVKPGGGSFAYTPLVCLGSGNLPGGELSYYSNGLASVFYDLDKYPGGAANADGRRPLLDNFMAYGPGMEGFEQNEILYETLSEMGWRQEPFTGGGGSPSPATGYATEGTDHAIFKAYLANYVSNRYNFNDQNMADFMWTMVNAGGFYNMTTGNPGHSFEYSFYTYGTPWASRRGGNAKIMIDNYNKFRKIVNRHKGDAHKNQLFMDDLALYTMDYMGLRFDETMTEVKKFIDQHSSEIQKEGTPERATFETYRELFKWYYHTMDRVMANTTLWSLERWVKFAREWEDQDSKGWFEADAKRILTVWGPDTVSDYAARTWHGLIKYQEACRLHGFDLIEEGKDPKSWQPHAQYKWSEENFEQPVLPDSFWAKPFDHPYEKYLELLTLMPKIDIEGTISADQVALTQKEEGVFMVTGTPAQFLNRGTTGGIAVNVTMAEMNNMKGKWVKLELLSKQAIHVDKLLLNDATTVNSDLTTVNKDIESGKAIYVQIPNTAVWEGGNNGDLTLVIEGTGKDGQALTSNVIVKVKPIDGNPPAENANPDAATTEVEPAIWHWNQADAKDAAALQELRNLVSLDGTPIGVNEDYEEPNIVLTPITNVETDDLPPVGEGAGGFRYWFKASMRDGSPLPAKYPKVFYADKYYSDETQAVVNKIKAAIAKIELTGIDDDDYFSAESKSELAGWITDVNGKISGAGIKEITDALKALGDGYAFSLYLTKMEGDPAERTVLYVNIIPDESQVNHIDQPIQILRTWQSAKMEADFKIISDAVKSTIHVAHAASVPATGLNSWSDDEVNDPDGDMAWLLISSTITGLENADDNTHCETAYSLIPHADDPDTFDLEVTLRPLDGASVPIDRPVTRTYTITRAAS